MAEEPTENVRDQALEVIAAEILLQIVQDPDPDDGYYQDLREDNFPDLDEDDFDDAVRKLPHLLPPLMWPRPGETEIAYRTLAPPENEDDDW